MILDKNEDPELIYENIWRMHKKKIHRICKPVKKSEEKKADMDLIKSPWRIIHSILAMPIYPSRGHVICAC